MSIKDKLLDSRVALVFDFTVGGWDLRESLVQYMDGNVFFGTLMLVLGIVLIVLGYIQLRITIENAHRGNV